MSKTSVIICHFRGRLIERCIKSLEYVDAEKIVITTDDTWKKPESINRSLCLTPLLNKPTYKRNIGADLSKGKYLCFLDDDVEVEQYCIENMEDYLENNPEVGMVYALLYKMDNHSLVDTSGSFLSNVGFLYETYVDRAEEVAILSGKSACCMIRRDIFKQVGKFDEDFVIYGEETDLSWRVWLAGYKVMLLPSAKAYHAFETPLKPRYQYTQTYIHYHGCKNYVTTLLKNLPTNKLYIAWINFSIWGFMGCCLWFRNREGGRLIFKGLKYVITHYRYIMFKRKLINRKDETFLKSVTLNPPISYYFNRFKEYLIHRLHGYTPKVNSKE